MLEFGHVLNRRRLATLIALVLVVNNLLLLTPDGSPPRVIAALICFLLPGLAWAQFLLTKTDLLLRWMVGLGLGFVLAIILGLLLHMAPGPIMLWQWIAAVDLLVIVPVVGLLLVHENPPERVYTEPVRQLLIPLLLIVMLGGIFRFATLNYSEYQGDEIEAVAPSARAVEGFEDALTLQRRKAPAEVLLPMLMWRTTGVLTEGSARLPFAVAGLLTIPCCYLLGRRLLNVQTGLAAALIVSLCGLLVAFSRIVQYQSVVVWMTALSLICAWEWRTRGSLRWAALAGAFLGAGLLAHYDAIVVVPALAYVAVTTIIERKQSKYRLRWPAIAGSLTMAGACLLVAAAFYIGYLMDPQFGSTGSYLSGRIGSNILYDNFSNFLHVTTVYNSFYFLVAIGLLAWVAITWPLLNRLGGERLTGKRRWLFEGLALASLGMWLGIWRFVSFELAAICFLALLLSALMMHSVSWEQRSVLIWGGSGFLAFVFVVQNPGTHVYVIMAPWALLAGLGAVTLYNRIQSRWATRFVVAGAAVGALVLSGYLFAVYLRQDVEYSHDWPASRLSFYWAPDNYDDPSNLSIFGMVHRSGWKAAGAWMLHDNLTIPYDSNEKPGITVWYMRNAARPSRDEQDFCAEKAHTYFLVDDLNGSADNFATEPGFFSSYQRVGTIKQVNGKGIAIYSSLREPSGPIDLLDPTQLEKTFDRTATPDAFVHEPQPQSPLNANFGNQVRLLGFDIDCITQDGNVAVTLYWKALAPLTADYYSFVHVEGGIEPASPQGIWGQSDGVPGNVNAPLYLSDTSLLLSGQPGGAVPAPTSTWRAGQVIRDRRSFQIVPETPKANYALVAGLYQPESGERLNVLDANNMPVANYVKLTDITFDAKAQETARNGP